MLKWYIQENMNPCVVLVLLVRKKDETWRMYVDCRTIINITKKYRYLTPRLDDMLDELHESFLFFKIDLKSRYRHVKMKKCDKWKTVFKIKYDLYEWLYTLLLVLWNLELIFS